MYRFGPYNTDEDSIHAWLDQFSFRYNPLGLAAAKKAKWLKSVIGIHGWEVTACLADEIEGTLFTAFESGNAAQEAHSELMHLLSRKLSLKQLAILIKSLTRRALAGANADVIEDHAIHTFLRKIPAYVAQVVERVTHDMLDETQIEAEWPQALIVADKEERWTE